MTAPDLVAAALIARIEARVTAAFARVLRAAVDSPDPFPALRALLADLERGAAQPVAAEDVADPMVFHERWAGHFTGVDWSRVDRAGKDIRIFYSWDGGEETRKRAENAAAKRAEWHRVAGQARSVEMVPEPDPARADVLLRFRYQRGVFVILDVHGNALPIVCTPNRVAVSGLFVRIVYTYAQDEREEAESCASAWAGRLRERGAREVVTEGEVGA